MELFITDRRLLDGFQMPGLDAVEPRVVLDRAAVAQGMPFILDADGAYDVRLNAWLAELPANDSTSRHTWTAYARDLLIWVRWLFEARDGKTVWDAGGEDFRAFYFARCRSENPAERVGPATWARQRSTMTAFYEYAVGCGYVSRNPCRTRGLQRQRGRGHRQGLASSSSSPPAKHLSIPAFLLLREIGMRGRPAPDSQFRICRRNASRNAAAANLVVSTGLRLEEFSLLLLPQIPVGLLEPGDKLVKLKVDRLTAKGNRERFVFVPIRYLRDIWDYVQIERSVAVSRAQQSGRYEKIDWRRTRVDGDRAIESGRSYPVERLAHDERMRLFVDTDAGGEPAALWLNEDGLPMGYEAWKSTMRSAAKACGHAGHPLHATWHTLRHTFAVHTLACLMELVFGDRAREFDPTKEKDRALMLDPIRELQLFLGHADFRTTWNWYLANAEPARRLLGRAVETFVDEIVTSELPQRVLER